MAHLWYTFYLRLDEFPTVALFAHDNVLAHVPELNYAGTNIFSSVMLQRWGDLSYNIFRTVYLIFLSEHFDRRMLDINDGGIPLDLNG